MKLIYKALIRDLKIFKKLVKSSKQNIWVWKVKCKSSVLQLEKILLTKSSLKETLMLK